MSIAVLTQVYDEMRRLAIAGSVVAGGDFRLKKLIAPLEQAGAKAPIFAKVGQAVKALVESNEQTSSDALLELATLVNAILYTQGETGAAGPIEPIQTTNLGPQTTQASARMLKPLLEALTETGSGRLEIIKDSFERGAFRDLRLVRPALGALDDPYPEIAEFVADKVLPLYGLAILPELKAKFDLKGKAGHLRRLNLLHRLDPAGTRDTVKQALESGSKEMKVVAIECLGDSPDDLAYLLEQAKAKNKEVRGAAFQALGRMSSDAATDVLQQALSSDDIHLVVAPVSASHDPKLLKFVISSCEAELEALFKTKDKKAISQHADRLSSLLECLRERVDRASEKLLLDIFSRRSALAAVKGDYGGQNVNELVIGLLTDGSKAMQNALIEAHATLDGPALESAFFIARLSRKPAEVYDLFAPYLTARVDEKKKQRDPAWAKRQIICDAITGDVNGFSNRKLGQCMVTITYKEDRVKTDWDPRWLDLALRIKNVELVCSLARPGHAQTNAILSEEFVRLRKSKDHDASHNVLKTMVRINHPEAVDCIMEKLAKLAKGDHAWGLYWFGPLIADLPKSAVPRLEELVPQLNEKLADQLLDYVTMLKNK